jgi:uncharacterized protein (DUF1330 family)
MRELPAGRAEALPINSSGNAVGGRNNPDIAALRLWGAISAPIISCEIRKGSKDMNRHITLGLAVVAGAALGAAAVQSLHAQAKPVAYVVSEITVTNQDAYDKEYVPPVLKSIQDGGGKFIARAGKTVTFLGTPPAPRVVLFQFESMDKAQAWFNSPANKAASPIGEELPRALLNFAKRALP